jgi:uncharacterized tellurite resistance protein B-like protein
MPANKFSDVLDQAMLDAEQRRQKRIDSKIAAAILLVAVVKADGEVNRMEFAEVIDILGKRFNMPPKEIGTLLEEASDSIEAEHDLAEFTLHLRNAWDQQERLNLLRSFWEIAIADDLIDNQERSLINRLASLLDLPSTEITKARERAEEVLQLKTAPKKKK